MRNLTINVQGTDVTVSQLTTGDFICLTDIVKAKQGKSRAADIIKNWLRSRTTLEFLGTWELLNNSSFNSYGFEELKQGAGLPTFVLSVNEWVEKTNGIGIISKSGRNGGTYAHKDIAFEFCAAISPVFKLYLIKEYQRLKEIESDKSNFEWDVKRLLSKVNYHIHTDAVNKHILPTLNIEKSKEWLVYAEEADLLNLCVFRCTAKDWREKYPDQSNKGLNLRDFASINELTVLSNLETLNSLLIKQGISKVERFKILLETATEQKIVLENVRILENKLKN